MQASRPVVRLVCDDIAALWPCAPWLARAMLAALAILPALPAGCVQTQEAPSASRDAQKRLSADEQAPKDAAEPKRSPADELQDLRQRAAALNELEQAWFQKFQNGSGLLRGWDDITRRLLARIPVEQTALREEVVLRREVLKYKIGCEWCRDNRVRKITHADQAGWGAYLRAKATADWRSIPAALEEIDRQATDRAAGPERVFDAESMRRRLQEELEEVMRRESALTPKEAGWFKTFQKGTFYLQGWDKVTATVLGSIPPSESQRREEVQLRMEILRYKIGCEWCKDNAVRKISNADLLRWASVEAEVKGDWRLIPGVLEIVDAMANQRLRR